MTSSRLIGILLLAQLLFLSSAAFPRIGNHKSRLFPGEKTVFQALPGQTAAVALKSDNPQYIITNYYPYPVTDCSGKDLMGSDSVKSGFCYTWDSSPFADRWTCNGTHIIQEGFRNMNSSGRGDCVPEQYSYRNVYELNQCVAEKYTDAGFQASYSYSCSDKLTAPGAWYSTVEYFDDFCQEPYISSSLNTNYCYFDTAENKSIWYDYPEMRTYQGIECSGDYVPYDMSQTAHQCRDTVPHSYQYLYLVN